MVANLNVAKIYGLTYTWRTYNGTISSYAISTYACSTVDNLTLLHFQPSAIST